DIVARAVEQRILIFVAFLGLRPIVILRVGLILLDLIRHGLPYRFRALPPFLNPPAMLRRDLVPFGFEVIQLLPVLVAHLLFERDQIAVDLVHRRSDALLKCGVVIAADLTLYDLSKLARVYRFKGIKLGRPFPESFLESTGTALGVLDRRP